MGGRRLAFQSLYHFTVGSYVYVEDPRLTRLPPYKLIKFLAASD